MKYLLVSLLTSLATCLPTGDAADYEYVVIGSGPGGGTLA